PRVILRLGKFRRSLCLHSRPGLRSAEKRDANVTAHEEPRSFAAECEATSVGSSRFRVKDLAAPVFRTVLHDAAQDDQTDHRRILPVTGTLATARRQFL